MNDVTVSQPYKCSGDPAVSYAGLDHLKVLLDASLAGRGLIIST